MKFPCIDHEMKGNADGYAQVYDSTRKRGVGLHRIVFERSYGFMPDCVLHKCDNPRCINPLHLAPGTVRTNNVDKMLKGRASGGARKLTDAQVREIRLSSASNYSLAKVYGVNESAISQLRRGLTYKGVT